MAVRTPGRSFGGTKTRSPGRQTSADFATQLGGLATILEVQVIPRRAAPAATTGWGEGASTPTPNRSEGPAAGLQVLGPQLLPVPRGLGRREVGG